MIKYKLFYTKKFIKACKILNVSVLKSIKYLFLGLRKDKLFSNGLERWLVNKITNRAQYNINETILLLHVINYYANYPYSSSSKYLYNEFLSPNNKLFINTKIYLLFEGVN